MLPNQWASGRSCRLCWTPPHFPRDSGLQQGQWGHLAHRPHLHFRQLSCKGQVQEAFQLLQLQSLPCASFCPCPHLVTCRDASRTDWVGEKDCSFDHTENPRTTYKHHGPKMQTACLVWQFWGVIFKPAGFWLSRASLVMVQEEHTREPTLNVEHANICETAARDTLVLGPHHLSAHIAWVSLQHYRSLSIQDFFPMHKSTAGSKSTEESKMLPKHIQSHMRQVTNCDGEASPTEQQHSCTFKHQRKLWNKKIFWHPPNLLYPKETRLCLLPRENRRWNQKQLLEETRVAPF